VHESYPLCDDVEEFITEMKKRIACSEIMGWDLLTEVKLPGGGKLGVYQPRHGHPKPMSLKKTTKKK